MSQGQSNALPRAGFRVGRNSEAGWHMMRKTPNRVSFEVRERPVRLVFDRMRKRKPPP